MDSPTDALKPADSLGSKLTGLLAKYPVIFQLLRFVAIGFPTTAVDFTVLNFVSKWLGVQAGTSLGLVNILGFIAAVAHSYIWQKCWTFSESRENSLLKNLAGLILVGGLGVVVLAAVLLGAKASAQPFYYLLLLAVLLLAEIVIWHYINLRVDGFAGKVSVQLAGFLIVSVIGAAINSALVSLLSAHLPSLNLSINSDLIKNLAKVFATIASLIWNFAGYKIFVFKK